MSISAYIPFVIAVVFGYKPFERWVRVMSIHGVEKLAPMGYVPKPPPMVKIRNVAPAISCADDATFDRWLALPPTDGRTLEEFAENPVITQFRWEMERPPGPPPPPPSTPMRTGGAIIHPLPKLPVPTLSFGPPPVRPAEPKNHVLTGYMRCSITRVNDPKEK